MNAHGPEDSTRIAVWTAVMFVSILVHKMGHALAGTYFGARPGIKLHGFGGLTYLPGGRFTVRKASLSAPRGRGRVCCSD